MCGIVGMVGPRPGQPGDLRRAAAAAAPRAGLDRHRDRRGQRRLPHAQGQGPGARGVPHPRHARPARQHRPRPRALRDEGRRASSEEEAQPFYVNAPYGIVLVHNGNLTNTRELTERAVPQRPPAPQHRAATPSCWSTCSPTSCRPQISGIDLDPEQVFDAVARVHERVEGSYAAIALIAGYGLLAFRDPFGIRPAHPRHAQDRGRRRRVDRRHPSRSCSRTAATRSCATCVPARRSSSTSTAQLHTKQCATNPKLVPCSFEYVYLARPDSIMNGISVYEARLRLGDRLADTIAKYTPDGRDRRRHADPRLVAARRDAGRAEARHRVPRGLLQEPLRRPHVHHARAGACARRACARSSTRCRASSRARTCSSSTTRSCAARPRRRSSQMARDAGANEVTFASAAPPVRYPHVYGINMPSRHELVAHGRTIPEIADGARRRLHDLPGGRRHARPRSSRARTSTTST